MTELVSEFCPLSLIPRLLGETIQIGFQKVRNVNGSNLWNSFASCSVIVYDKNGAVVLASTRIPSNPTNQTGTTVACKYPLTTGAGNNVPNAGVYRADYTILLSDGTIYQQQQYINVQPRPY